MPASVGVMNSFGIAAARDIVLELEPAPARQRLHANLDARVLAAGRRSACIVRVVGFAHCSRMVSRYATCGLPTLAPTPNSRIMRSTMISRCSSPIPDRMVCPVSGSVVNLERGIFLRQLRDRHAQLFLVGLGLRLDRELNHRSREVDRLEHDRIFSSQIVSPVETVFSPTAAADIARHDFRDLFALVGVHA